MWDARKGEEERELMKRYTLLIYKIQSASDFSPSDFLIPDNDSVNESYKKNPIRL